ncbi:hypothetical protein E4U21_004624 [Claviceps maximensis]|nr:hypothetical protein E4U21_004624 [Claviceps maximensis]
MADQKSHRSNFEVIVWKTADGPAQIDVHAEIDHRPKGRAGSRAPPSSLINRLRNIHPAVRASLGPLRTWIRELDLDEPNLMTLRSSLKKARPSARHILQHRPENQEKEVMLAVPAYGQEMHAQFWVHDAKVKLGLSKVNFSSWLCRTASSTSLISSHSSKTRGERDCCYGLYATMRCRFTWC